MTINECVNQYFEFLKGKTIVTETNMGWTQIRTPYINVFNDIIDKKKKKENDKILISDDSDTLRNLELAGIEFSRSPKRADFLSKICKKYKIV